MVSSAANPHEPLADLSDNGLVEQARQGNGAAFELIFANILAEPLVDLAPQIAIIRPCFAPPGECSTTKTRRKTRYRRRI